MAERLSDIAIQRELGNLPGWSRRGEVITKTFQFRSFLSGISFVSAIAKAAEAADHHPDIDIRYTKIVCTLSTHSAGGITQKDLDIAKQIDRALGKRRLISPVSRKPEYGHEHVEQIEVDLHCRADVLVGPVEVAQAPGVEHQQATEQQDRHCRQP